MFPGQHGIHIPKGCAAHTAHDVHEVRHIIVRKDDIIHLLAQIQCRHQQHGHRDAAGFRIRTYITGLVGAENVVQAYVPAIHGKEKRKPQPGKEGLLGVEGVDDAIVLQCLRDALGAEAGAAPARPEGRQITYTDLYNWGLSGTPGSAERKYQLLNALGLPPRLSKKELVEALNRLYSFEQLDTLQAEILEAH